ncbi:MAG: nucleotidyltransferase domain-containing protein [Candidatus Omnitrophota bacterium]
MVIDDSILNKLTEYLRNSFEITDIYLFGSAANGNFTWESDIDIALYLKDYNQHSLKEFAKTLFHVQNTISSRVELHFFPDKTEPLTFSAYVKNMGQKIA